MCENASSCNKDEKREIKVGTLLDHLKVSEDAQEAFVTDYNAS